MGSILIQQGKLDAAMLHLQEAVRVKPDYTEALNNQGIVLARKRDFAGAIQKYGAAIQTNPQYVPAQFNAGLAFMDKGSPDEAIQHFTKCLEMVPNAANVHYNLALVLAGKGRLDKAIGHYQRTLAINPQMLEALDNLAWILASNPNPQFRNGAEDVRLSEDACRLTDNREATLLGTLGAAYAEDGRFEEAVDAAKKAEALATAAGNKELSDKNHRMAEIFILKCPFHEQPLPLAPKPASSSL